ncbi:MAG: NAD(P)/FAD-dependent oxidoreductase, partial [Bacteroidota bacterium]
GNIQKALRLLVEHGAKSDILTDAHPHIGSNKLPGVVQNIRETIEHYGGEVHFDHFVTDLMVRNGQISGVVATLIDKEDNITREYMGDAVIMATGHSARDIYRLLHSRGIRIEAKPFALGVRVEHPQQLIDSVQYRQPVREDGLPAASYSLVCQVSGRGVFSFCMCPG